MKIIFHLPLLILLSTPIRHTCLCYSHSQITILPSFVWETSWSYPIESLAIGISILSIMYFRKIHSEQLLSQEKLGLVINILRRTYTPLALTQSMLEEMMTNDLSKAEPGIIKQILGYTNNVMDCYQNAMALDKMKEKMYISSHITDSEVYTYITSIVNQCRVYAHIRQIKLKLNSDPGFVHCQLNETFLTAALQCLLYKVIDITPEKNYINIFVSHFSNYWNLQITNYPDDKEDYKRIVFPFSLLKRIHYCNDLRIIRKIIHQHGGKISGNIDRHSTNFQIIVPTNCHCNASRCSLADESPKQESNDKDPKCIATNTKQSSLESNKIPHILLLIEDKELSDYLSRALSAFSQTSILKEPEEFFSNLTQQQPDAIIIDEIVNGIYGDELCSRIKSDIHLSSIPVVLLISSNDNESYLTHIHSGADKLELRRINIGRLKADIQMLISNHQTENERFKNFIENNPLAGIPEKAKKEDTDAEFINKVQGFLEKNLFTEKYTINMLCKDMGMSRTNFYNKIKKIIGKTPEDYIRDFKMDKARTLLISHKYNVTEIADLLGYCDAKYFGKQFKAHYGVPPTQYINNVL